MGLEASLQQRDFPTVVAQMEPRDEVCPGGAPQGAGGPFPLCDGAVAGEMREGYLITRRYSEGGIYDAEATTEFFESFLDNARADATDDFGSGEPRLFSLSCEQGPEATCRAGAIIFGAILGPQGESRREVLAFYFDYSPGAPVRLIRVTDGVTVQEEEAEALFGSGGFVFDFGQVYPLR